MVLVSFGAVKRVQACGTTRLKPVGFGATMQTIRAERGSYVVYRKIKRTSIAGGKQFLPRNLITYPRISEHLLFAPLFRPFVRFENDFLFIVAE